MKVVNIRLVVNDSDSEAALISLLATDKRAHIYAGCPVVDGLPVMSEAAAYVTLATGEDIRERLTDNTEFSLSDCVNYESNVMGDCGGRVEYVKGRVICETCRNR